MDSEFTNYLEMNSILLKKKGKKHCEDFIGNGQGLYWLFDGASVPRGLEIIDGWNASWYVHRLNLLLQKKSIVFEQGSPLEALLAEVILDISAEINQYFTKVDYTYYLPSCTVVMVRVTEQYLDYLVLGDSYLLVETDTNLHVVTDDRLSKVRFRERVEILNLLKSGVGYNSTHIEYLKQIILRDEIKLRNTNEGFWIASNVPQAAYQAKSGRIPLFSGDWSVLLFSDGIGTAVTELNLFSSWQELIQFIHENDLEALTHLIRQREKQDPDGWRYPRFSSSDDASAIIIRRS